MSNPVYRKNAAGDWIRVRNCRHLIQPGDNLVVVAPRLDISYFSVFTLCIFNDKIYGGTYPGGLLEWNGTDAWVEVAPPLGNIIYKLLVFNNKLYATTGLYGRLYEWNGTDDWILVAPGYVPFPDSSSIQALVIFNDKLYGGSGGDTGGRLYEWNGTDAWVLVAPIFNGQEDIYSLCVFNDKIYGGTGPASGRLFEWNGVDSWVQVAPMLNGQSQIASLCVFNGKIYGGTRWGGRLLEWNGVNAWVQVAPTLNGQGIINCLQEINSELFASTGIMAGGNSYVFKWNGIDAWTEVANTVTYPQSDLLSLIEYHSNIYAGSSNRCLLFELIIGGWKRTRGVYHKKDGVWKRVIL